MYGRDNLQIDVVYVDNQSEHSDFFIMRVHSVCARMYRYGAMVLENDHEPRTFNAKTDLKNFVNLNSHNFITIHLGCPSIVDVTLMSSQWLK